MRWHELKAELLAVGSCRLTGADASSYSVQSAAGPGAGGPGSVFFSAGGQRVRLTQTSTSPVEIVHEGNGRAFLRYKSIFLPGILEQPALHCPRQAYVTVSGRCIFSCKYCPVPSIEGTVKTPDEIAALIDSVADQIDAISITSGVLESIEDEEQRVLAVLRRIMPVEMPVGVSIYPGPDTPEVLYSEGVSEVKFNLEAATPDLFRKMCPELSYDGMLGSLDDSVTLFGRGNVYSNVIIGLGETDEEMDACIRLLTERGVIPVLRPLTPAADLAAYRRPDADRLLRIAGFHRDALKRAGLDTRNAKTMCTFCTGCDIVPGRDCA